MKIAVVGTGYVGLVSAACFAELGHDVVGVDIDKTKVQKLKKGVSPIYEPGLEELLKRNLKEKRLRFTSDLTSVLNDRDVVFSAVGTPPGKNHHADLRAVFAVATIVAEHTERNIVFVNKSTVPVGTGEECQELIATILKKRGISVSIPVISNPEFLREGMAVPDTMMPERFIIGINGHAWAKDVMEELYRPITRVGKPIVFMQRESAEIVKYAANAFLAMKISFINMMSELCEVSGANIRDVALGIGLDSRIGPRFLHAGIGYGGSCFPKDVKALMATAKEKKLDFALIAATDEINQYQRRRFFQKILKTLPAQATVAVWGLSFKPKTDDLRDAPSLDLIPMLTKAKHTVRVFDPEAMEKAGKGVRPSGRKGSDPFSSMHFASSPLDAAKGADAVVLLTEWDVFRGIDLQKLRDVMKGKDLFDGRNVYEPKEVEEAGLVYHGIGIGDKEL